MARKNIYTHADNPCYGCNSLACATCACNTGESSERDEVKQLRVSRSKGAEQSKKQTSGRKFPRYITVSPEIFGYVGKAVVFTADCDGMKGAGILTGDYIIFDTSLAPKNGDVVMANIDGDLYCRRYFQEGDKGRFRREDGITEDVITADFNVLGVMIGLVRKVDRAG